MTLKTDAQNHSIMANSYLIPIFLAIMFFSVSVATSTFSKALPGCEDQELCGNVSIPFPFGTRESCYLNEHFLIQCNKSSDGTLTTYLRKGVFTVTDISLEGQMGIIGHTGTDCYFPKNDTRSDLHNSPWSQIGKPMVINSTANKFIAIGCDTYATINGSSSSGRKFTTGCMSVCFNKDDVADGACSGIGCCQTSIPEGTWSISVKLDSYYNHSFVSDFNPCSYAFVVQESAFHFSADNLSNTALSVPVVVDWAVADKVTCEEAKKTSTYICSSQNSECYDQKGAVGYRCRCAPGFEGNPYLPNNGCRDIDECVSSSLHSCPDHSTCVNTWGSYNCSCNQGYHQGGNVKECIADQPRGKRNLWPIYAVVGVSGSSAVLIFLSFCLYSKYIRRKEDKLRQEYYRKNGGFLLQEELSTRSKNGATSYSSTIFTEEELRKATNDFDSSQIIGEGGFGTVYKGELTNKTIVAIKKSKGVNQREVGQFINEVILLSKINDQNVVKLLGCCLQTEVPLLVYEFISNGTLFEHLHIRRNVNNASKLSWSIRLRIASEVARVLSYLHSFSSPPIIHRDIKSCNILLDDNYKAKVADFGISRLVTVDENQLSTIVQGTPGYLDPEYMHTGVLTEKSDVYSFGIVLIELLSGRKVFSGDRPEAERFLSNCFLRYLEDGNLVGVLDHNMVVNDGNVKQMKEVALIAKRCIGVKGEDRPCMKEVARQLETLEMEAHPLFFQTLEIESVESEALLGKKYAESYAVSDGYNCTSTSGDLYPVTTTTIQQMMSPTDCGR